MDPLADLLALLDRITELTDEELASLEAGLEAQAEARAESPTDEQLAELEQIAAGVEAVRSEAQARADAAIERQQRATEALARIRATPPEDEATEDEHPAEEDETEEEDAPEPAPEPAPEEEPQAIVASVPPPARPPRIGRVAARRPASVAPRPSEPSAARWNLVASANVANIAAGERLDDPEKLAHAVMSAIQSTKGYRHGPRIKVPVARAGSEEPREVGYDESRILTDNPRENARKLRAVKAQAMTASGGICAPQQVRYDLPTLGDEGRPVRDEMLVRFGADRGGVTTLDLPILTDLDGAVGIWTEANDQNPTNPAVKPCLTLTCPDDNTTVVEAITQCLQFGNFRARFFAEQIDAWVRLAAVNHARRAETRLLTTVGAGSTQVTTGEILDAGLDVLAVLDRAIAEMQSRNRDMGLNLRFGVPFWLLNLIRVGFTRQLPGAGWERLRMTFQDIVGLIESRGVNLTTFLDGESGQVLGPQGDGPLNGWPSTVVTYLYPEGDWLFLDGGTLDLGIVRDSTLNATNDVQMFAETFEGAHHHGPESLRIAMDLCPDGSTSGAVDISPCGTGS